MNPQGNDRMPSLDLPKPQTEQFVQGSEVLPFNNATEKDNAVAIEQGVPSPVAPAIPQPQPVTAPQYPAEQPVTSAPAAAPIAGTPAIADDADLIEKEWVEKAKEIVEQTRQDPYLQNKEINKMKADYMKKRYNKDINLEE